MLRRSAGELGVTVLALLPIGGVQISLSVVVGGAWTLLNLWCLTRLLQAWLRPSPARRRVLGWVLVKFPLLYLLVCALLASPGISPLGFGIGLTVVLVSALILLALQARHVIPAGSHESRSISSTGLLPPTRAR